MLQGRWACVQGVMEGVPASRDYEGGFALAHMVKDLNLALAASKAATSLELPMGRLALDLYTKVHPHAPSVSCICVVIACVRAWAHHRRLRLSIRRRILERYSSTFTVEAQQFFVAAANKLGIGQRRESSLIYFWPSQLQLQSLSSISDSSTNWFRVSKSLCGST